MSLKRIIEIGMLGVLALGGCDPRPVVSPRPGATSSASVSAADTPSAAKAPVHGASIVVEREALLVADGDHLTRVPLPLGSAPPRRVAMGGDVEELVVIGDEVLVTVREPGALVRVRRDDLSQQKRISMPEGAGAIAVHGNRALIAAPEGKVVGIELGSFERAWTVDVPAPRDIVIAERGDMAVVTHAVGVTRMLLPSRKVTSVLPHALEPRVSHTADGAVVAYGVLPASLEPRAQVATVSQDAVGTPRSIDAHVRAFSASARDVAVTSNAVIEVGGALEVAQPCRDPRGVALSEDASRAFVLCRGGRILDVPLAGGEPKTASLAPPPTVAVSCDGVTKGPVAPEHREKFGTADQIHDWLRRYHCNHPDLTDLIQIGTTHLGRPVMALVIGNAPRLGHDKPTFFINGAHHGSELMSSMFALDAIDKLLEDRHPAVPRWLREDVVFVVVPLVNPDGNMAYLKDKLLGRKNGRDTDGDGKRGHTDGVDLNRNYPFRWHSLGEQGSSSKIHSRYYRGPSPGSEPETQAVMRLAESERFAGSISFHTGTLAILAPYTIPKVKNPTPNEAWTVAEGIAKEITGHPEGFVPVKKNLYAVDGTDQDWMRNEHGTVALLVEGADNWLVDVRTRKKMVFWIRRSWVNLVDRYLDGAAVGGHVYDAVMRPIEADVSFAEIYRPEKESWTSRCRDGRFDRYLSKPGDYTLTVTLGEHEAKKTVSVRKEKRTKTNVVLPVLVTEPARCPTIWSSDEQPAKVMGVTPRP